MGRFVAKINNTYAEYHDSFWDYVKHNKPKEYYDNIFCDVELEEGDIKYQEKIPLQDLIDIKIVKTNYDWYWNDKKKLHKWLFNYLKNREEKVECYIEATIGTFYLNYDKPLISGYYLQSEIGDENIVLGLEKKLHEIKDYEDYEWLRLRFLKTSN
jgi:hypothetical protein